MQSTWADHESAFALDEQAIHWAINGLVRVGFL